MENIEVMLSEDNILTTFSGDYGFGICLISEEKHNPKAEKGSDEEYVNADGRLYYFEHNYGMNKGYTPMHRCKCIKCGHTYEAKNMIQHSEGNMICTPCKSKSSDAVYTTDETEDVKC